MEGFYPSSPPIAPSTNPNGRSPHLPSLRAPHSTGSIGKIEKKLSATDEGPSLPSLLSGSPPVLSTFLKEGGKPLPKGDRRLANANDFIPPPPSLPVTFPQEARVDDAGLYHSLVFLACLTHSN